MIVGDSSVGDSSVGDHGAGGYPALPASDDPIAVVVAFIAVRPGLSEHMLGEHARDQSGYCRRCRNHLRPERWPCFDARMALLARDYIKKRRATEIDHANSAETNARESDRS